MPKFGHSLDMQHKRAPKSFHSKGCKEIRAPGYIQGLVAQSLAPAPPVPALEHRAVSPITCCPAGSSADGQSFVSALSMALSWGSSRTVGSLDPLFLKWNTETTGLIYWQTAALQQILWRQGPGEAEPEARHVYPGKCQQSPGEHTIQLHHSVPPSRCHGNQMPGWKSTRRWTEKLQVSESPAQPYLLLQAIHASQHSLVSCQFPSTAVVCGCNAQHLSPLSPSRPAQKLDVQHVAVQGSQDSQNWPLSMKTNPSLLLYLLQGLKYCKCGFVRLLGPSGGICEERLQITMLYNT